MKNNYNIKKLNPGWISGFTDGEGSFVVMLFFHKNNPWGLQSQFRFAITQHIRDLDLLYSIKAFFNNIGNVNTRQRGVCDYVVVKREDLKNTIIPFFNNNPLFTVKSKAFDLFKELFDMADLHLHHGSSLAARDQLIAMIDKILLLNTTLLDGRTNKLVEAKIARYTIIKTYLLSLSSAPTLEQKLELKRLIDTVKLNGDSQVKSS